MAGGHFRGADIFHEPALFTCGLAGEGAAFIDGALGVIEVLGGNINIVRNGSQGIGGVFRTQLAQR